MRKINARVILLGLIFTLAVICQAQSSSFLPEASAGGGGAALAIPAPAHTFADLNLLGADVHMPPFDDTIFGSNVDFRRAMLRHGMALRVNPSFNFSANMLDAPVAPDQQSYTGQRPYEKVMISPILTLDLKALHLRNAQLYVSGGLLYVTWQKSGPNAALLSALYLYKSFAEGRVEMKAGYMTNSFEFVGFHVGGSLSTSSQGVYAVLPYEAGLSYFPLPTPSFNLRWNAPKKLYAKGALQRSTDPAGGQATVARNAIGLRFIPDGDKLVMIFEGGMDKPATNSANATWIRGGLIRNTTPFTNNITGVKESGNYCAYLLADQQVTQGFGKHSNGLYLGASVEIAPARFNQYSQYYEGRAYLQGPFHSRPSDLISVIMTRSVHSQDTIRNLIAQGKTVWRHTNTATVSYSYRAGRGVYLSGGLSYLQGPAVTPRVPNAMVGSLATSLFF